MPVTGMRFSERPVNVRCAYPGIHMLIANDVGIVIKADKVKLQALAVDKADKNCKFYG